MKNIIVNIGTDGSVSCSDDMLNQIHRAARQSTLTNLHGIFTDCPQREQNGRCSGAALQNTGASYR